MPLYGIIAAVVTGAVLYFAGNHPQQPSGDGDGKVEEKQDVEAVKAAAFAAGKEAGKKEASE